MEVWQRDHITKNLPDLIKLVNPSLPLLDDLLASGCICDADHEEIASTPGGRLCKASVLLKSVQARVDGYVKLINALERYEQSGAVTILKKHPNAAVLFQQSGSESAISFSNWNLKLGSKECEIPEIVEDWQNSAVAARLLEDWAKLARKLKLTTFQINLLRKKIDKDPKEIFEVMTEMLELWQLNNGDNATAGALITALGAINWKEFENLVRTRCGIPIDQKK